MSVRSRFTNLGIGQKLYASALMVLVVSLIATGMAFRASVTAREAFTRVADSQTIVQEAIDIESAVYNMQFGFRSYMLTGDIAYRDAYLTNANSIVILLGQLRSRPFADQAQLDLWASIDTRIRTWHLEVARPGIVVRNEANENGGDIQPAIDFLIDASARDDIAVTLAELEQSRTLEQQRLAERIETVTEHSADVRQTLLAGAIIVALVALATAWLVSRDVANAMKRLTFVAGRVAEGDYHQRVNLNRHDEIGQTAAAFDTMTRRLSSTIAEYDATAEQMRLNQSHTRDILENISEGIFTFSGNGIIDSLNPAATSMFGFSEGDLIGLPVGTIVTIGSAGRADDSGKRTFHGDALGHRSDGSSFPIELTITEMEMAGAPRFIAVTRNISDIIEADRRLRRRNRDLDHLRSISGAMLDTAGEALILISPRHTIMRINRRFAEFFEVTEEQVTNQPMTGFGRHLDRVFQDPDAFRTVLYGTIDDGEAEQSGHISQVWPVPRELEFFTRPVRTDTGELLGRLYAFRDVTQEREVDRMKTEFVSLVSHELRTPLTSIKGYVDLLLEGEVGELEPEQKEFLEIVGANSDRLVALIGDLLDISRIESGKIELAIVPNPVTPLIESIAASFRPMLETKEQRIALEFAPDLPAVAADTARLNQILVNLISNAHKYSPVGTTITLRATSFGDRVAIAIQDQGIGMTEDELGHLFTRFYRARNRTTQEVGGTGLGLAITRSLIELQGGAITVDSTPGQGSVFTVTLPVAESGIADTSETPLTPDGAVTGHVLIVEDEPDIASLIRRYLERAGFTVTTASTARNALDIVTKTRIDLITLDVMLPDSDGFTLLEQFKQAVETADIPIIMLSMLPDDGQGRSLGAVDYLVKPVREQTLIAHISGILRQVSLPASATIIVADDDPDIRALIARNLGSAGYHAIPAADGQEAVDLAIASNPDLILLDVRMPHLDGVGALQQLRTIPHLRDVPIVMMTASPGVEAELQPNLASLGVADLLRKPLTAADLASALQRAMATMRQEHPT
jgi:PAS domain S-box-containing protein